MNVLILETAEREIEEAVDYYNEQLPGLGFEFAIELKEAIARIVDFPDAWIPFSKNSRKCLINRYPYAILYQVEDETILIHAVMHLKRDPLSWQKRIQK